MKDTLPMPSADHSAEPIAAPALYVVATPIGNLEDITLRALRVLRGVSAIVCEDTRVTSRLLSRYSINKPLLVFNAHATAGETARVVDVLSQGGAVALVTDAGTPGISDPGCLLVAAVRAALPEVPIVPIPGPSAVVAALSVSGLPTSDFLFLGFLPHKKGRETLFAEIAASSRAVVFYESPHRIEKTLARLAELLPPERTVFVAREISKLFESVVSGPAATVRDRFLAAPETVRGEFVVVVAGA